MNRLASAFSNAPSLGSHPADPPRPSPLESTFSVRSEGEDPRRRSVSPHAALYDDPRQVYFPDGSWGRAALTLSRRPGLLRQHTDEGLSRSATPRPRSRDPDNGSQKAVKVNLLAERGQSSRGWGMSHIPGSSRITAMAAGPDGRYAVGGNQYLRVIQIKAAPSGATTPMPPGHAPEPLGKGPGGTTVTEVTNLWRGQWGVKGVNDIDWGVGQMSNKIVSACPSGNILIFDVTKGKIDREITGGHNRPMNALRLCKIPSASHVLLTGGMEGNAKIWDLREPSNAQKRYFKHSVAITSVAFCPDSTHHFLVGMDSGTIQRYDMRSPSRIAGKVWGAHGNKPVTDLKWKAGDEGGWMASAGADRTVQIWDMSVQWDKPASPLHVLHTAYPLQSVQWRPGHETELAIIPASQPTPSASVDPSIGSAPQGTKSGSAQVDDEAHLEVWDVRRHYIAKYAIGTTDGAAASLHWADEDTIVTAFRNGTFSQKDIRPSRTIPLDTVPRNITAWNKRGEMAFAMDRFKQGEMPFDDIKSAYSNHWEKVGQRPKGVADEPYEPAQAVGVMPPIETAAEEDHLVYMADRYRIEGQTTEWLCGWNAEVADSCGRRDDARFWLFLRAFVEEFTKDPVFDEKVFTNPLQARSQLGTPLLMSPRGHAKALDSPKPIPLERLVDTLDDVEELMTSSSSSSGSSSGSSETDDGKSHTPQRSRFIAFAPLDNRRLSESLTISSRQSSVATALPPTSGSARATPKTLFAQVVGQANARSKQRSGSSASNGNSDWPDPYGVSAGTPGSNRMTSSRLLNDYPDPYGVTTRSESSRASPATSKKASPQITANKNMPVPPRDSIGGPAVDGRDESYDSEEWEAYKRQRAGTVLDWWRCYVDDGELQLATTVYAVTRHIITFPEEQCERIVHAYVDMLEANRLPRAAAYIRRHSGVLSLEVRPLDEGMTHPVHCVKCRKSTGAVDLTLSEGKFWWCRNCKRPAKTCVICHKAVRGLWMSCGKCKHGGHQSCLRAYFASSELRTSNLPATTSALPTASTTSRALRSGRSSPPHTPNASSHESSGYDRFDRSRVSAETMKDSVIPEEGEEMKRGWNVCAKGCGCACRVVIAPVTIDEDA